MFSRLANLTQYTQNETPLNLLNFSSFTKEQFIYPYFNNGILILWLTRFLSVYAFLFLFLGIIKVLEPLTISVENIINKKTAIQWNKTVANLTLVAFSLNAFEIIYPTVELIQSGSEPYKSGPLLIIVYFK